MVFVKCQEIIELISAEVDGELDAENKNQLQDHLRECRQCCDKFELEKITKLYIGRKLKRTTSPAALRLGILRQLHPETDSFPSRQSFLRRIVNVPKWQVMTAFAGSAAIIIIALLLLPIRGDKAHTAPHNNNIIHQTFNNYNSILQGKFRPAIATETPAVAELYFLHDNQFQAYVPPMYNCRLIGAMYSKYTHEGIAHLVYRYEDNIIYILEVSIRDLLNQDGLALPDDVLAEVMKGDWYCEHRMEDYSLIMWIHNSILCCAITNISNQQLIACLTNK